MKALAWVLMFAATVPLVAQEPEDTVAAPPNGAEAQELRERIRQRWNEHVRSTLGLSDDQTARLQTTEQRFEGQRQPIRAHQREITQALNAELASGTPNQAHKRAPRVNSCAVARTNSAAGHVGTSAQGRLVALARRAKGEEALMAREKFGRPRLTRRLAISAG